MSSIRSNFQLFLSVVLFVSVLVFSGCGGGGSEGGGEDPVSSAPRELNWLTKADLDFKYGETIIFDGYLARAYETKDGKVFGVFSPRHAGDYQAGEIQVELSAHPDFAGHDTHINFIKEGLRDSTEVKTFSIYLKSGDTLTDAFLDRSKVRIQGKNEKKEEDYGEFLRTYELKLETLTILEPNFEEEYKDAVKLTSDFVSKAREKEREYTYVYIDGEFEMPNIVSPANSYTLNFTEEEGFYNISSMPVFIGNQECGKMARLYDGFYDTSVKFWDAELNEIRCNTPIRVYGLWDGGFSMLIEEFVQKNKEEEAAGEETGEGEGVEEEATVESTES